MKPQHPIGVVTSRTRLTPELLRAWERRYAAVVPSRSGTGRRLYSEADIEKLQLLKRLVDGGRRISDVAALSLPELRELEHGDRVARLEDTRRFVPSARGESDGAVAELLSRAAHAIEELDRRDFENVLAEATVKLSPTRLRDDLIVPLMTHIGEQWHAGGLRIAHEHMATVVIKSFLYAMQQKRPTSQSAPRLLACTLPGFRHELGALLAASVAAEQGWDVTYLGPDIPAAEIAAAVHQRQASAVLVSLVFTDDSSLLQQELRWLRELGGEGLTLIAGGDVAVAHRVLLDELGILCSDSLGDFAEQLASLR